MKRVSALHRISAFLLLGAVFIFVYRLERAGGIVERGHFYKDDKSGHWVVNRDLFEELVIKKYDDILDEYFFTFVVFFDPEAICPETLDEAQTWYYPLEQDSTLPYRVLLFLPEATRQDVIESILATARIGREDLVLFDEKSNLGAYCKAFSLKVLISDGTRISYERIGYNTRDENAVLYQEILNFHKGLE